MELPVMWVRLKSNGRRVGINVADFNSDLHAPLPDEGKDESEAPKVKSDPPPSPPEDEKAKAAPPDVHVDELNAKDAVVLVAETDNLAILKAFAREEKAGKKRKSVLKALDDRRAAISEEGEK